MKFIIFAAGVLSFVFTGYGQTKTASGKIAVIAYYAGDANSIDAYPVEKLSHIIFSFCHLKGNRLSVDSQKDSLTIQHLSGLKKRNPSLKVILSLGGWGGCETCSPVFTSEAARKEFALSVKQLNDYFKTDGIDLDWEYPAIEGYPGHRYGPEDKANFTSLVSVLRETLGNRGEISFAAGGFTKFLETSIEWDKVAPMVDKINIMTYDLVHGFSTETGHHTPLYSTLSQIESTDHAVRFLDSIGVPMNKLVIGAAFYGRIFSVSNDASNGLYQPAQFSRSISFLEFDKDSLVQQGFTYHWDETAQAPYFYSPVKKEFITLDDKKSIRLKARYAVEKGLNGIMFWELGNDKITGGLLDEIYMEIRK